MNRHTRLVLITRRFGGDGGALFRAVAITWVMGRACLRIMSYALTAGREQKSEVLAFAGEQLAAALESLGGIFVKVGQILGTRRDLFTAELLLPLERLHDDIRPFSGALAASIVTQALGRRMEEVFSEFDPEPVASASIGQVHRAILRDSDREVVVKIRRPGINRACATDIRMLQIVISIAAAVPLLRGLPLREGILAISESLMAQTDFEREAETHRLFWHQFAEAPQIQIPRLEDELCSSEILVMEYFPNLTRLSDPGLDPYRRRSAVLTGLQALYRMIFVMGIIHCDLHPGNILVAQDGKTVILDFGFAAHMEEDVRTSFVEFFLSIAFNDGFTAARILKETAASVPTDLDNAAFESDICILVDAASGQSSGTFLVAQFVYSLFQIQRKHRIYGSPSFAAAILSLLVYEGIVRSHCPDVDFQREAVPYLLSSLN